MALAAGCGTANPDATTATTATVIKYQDAVLSMLARSGKLRALFDLIKSFDAGAKFKGDSLWRNPRPDLKLLQYIFFAATQCTTIKGGEFTIFGECMYEGETGNNGGKFKVTVRRAAALPPRALGDRVSRSPPSQLPDGWSTAWVPPTVEDYAWADRMKALVDAVGLALETAARAPALSQLVDAHAALSASAADGTPWATKYSRLGPHIASLEAAMVQPAIDAAMVQPAPNPEMARTALKVLRRDGLATRHPQHAEAIAAAIATAEAAIATAEAALAAVPHPGASDLRAPP